MNDIKFCRNCIYWETTSNWRGNCGKHPWEDDKYSQDASPNTMGCRDYTERQIKMLLAKEI